MFVQVIPRFSFKVRFDFCKIFVSLEFQSKTRKFRMDGGGVKTKIFIFTKLGDEIENLTRTYGSLLSDRSNFF